MLILDGKKFIPAPFVDEAELEKVVFDNFEDIFGPSSIYVSKALIKTFDGAGTIPDGFSIDLLSEKWFLVEAELSKHSVWSHISPQVTKQIIAALKPDSKKTLSNLFFREIQENENFKEKFKDLGIPDINIFQTINRILEKPPIIAIPIDNISNDLNEWTKTQKYDVRLWIISKYVDFKNPTTVIYGIPDEFKPALDTEEEVVKENEGGMNRYDVSILDLIQGNFLKQGDSLIMNYKPKNGMAKRYEPIINEDGSLTLLNTIFLSPSYAALAAIQDSGSSRSTVNGWTAWKTYAGKTLADLRQEYLNKKQELRLLRAQERAKAMEIEISELETSVKEK